MEFIFLGLAGAVAIWVFAWGIPYLWYTSGDNVCVCDHDANRHSAICMARGCHCMRGGLAARYSGHFKEVKQKREKKLASRRVIREMELSRSVAVIAALKAELAQQNKELEEAKSKAYPQDRVA